MKDKALRHEFRKERTRRKLSINTERPRLSVRRSNKHLYAQVIDDNKGTTLAFASSLSKEAKGTKSIASATKLGALIAKKAIEKGVKQVRFDRGGRIYHGRVKAVAEAARAAGLEF